MHGTQPTEHKGRGILAVIAAVSFFSAADTMAKWLGHQDYPTIEIVFFRYVFGLLPVGVLIWKTGIDSLRTRRPWAHAGRACLIVCALALFFWGLKLMPLAEAVAIAFVAPLFVTALSVPLLGEHVGTRRWCAVIIGFLGALVVLQPGTDAFRPEALIIIASAFMFSLAMIVTRRMSRTETTTALFTYTTLGAALISAPFLGFAWKTPSVEHIGLFACLGLVGGIAALLIIIAYRNAPASVVAPFEYTHLIWTSIAGWLLWDEQPGTMVWTGAAIIILSSLYIARREAGDDGGETTTNKNPGA